MLALGAALPAMAQPLAEVQVAAGLAIPTGGAATRRSIGPSLMVSGGSIPRPLAWRLEVSWDGLDGPPVLPTQTWNSLTGDLSILGISAGGIWRLLEAAVSPYLITGVGVYSLQRVGGDPSPYGATLGAHAALGADFEIGSALRPFAEARYVFHLTDYGSNEWSPTTYFTLRAGVQFHW